MLAVILHLLFTLCYRGDPCPEFTHSGEGSVFKTPLFCSGVGSSDAPVETTTVSAMVKLLRDALKIKGYPEFENIKKLLHIGRNQGVKRAAEAMMDTTKALQQIGMPVAQVFYIHNRSICTHFEFWLARAAVVVGDAALTPVVILWPLSQFRRLGNWVNEQTSVLEMSYMPNCPRAALGPAAGFRETDAIQTARELVTLHEGEGQIEEGNKFLLGSTFEKLPRFADARGKIPNNMPQNKATHDLFAFGCETIVQDIAALMVGSEEERRMVESIDFLKEATWHIGPNPFLTPQFKRFKDRMAAGLSECQDGVTAANKRLRDQSGLSDATKEAMERYEARAFRNGKVIENIRAKQLQQVVTTQSCFLTLARMCGGQTGHSLMALTLDAAHSLKADAIATEGVPAGVLAVQEAMDQALEESGLTFEDAMVGERSRHSGGGAAWQPEQASAPPQAAAATAPLSPQPQPQQAGAVEANAAPAPAPTPAATKKRLRSKRQSAAWDKATGEGCALHGKMSTLKMLPTISKLKTIAGVYGAWGTGFNTMPPLRTVAEQFGACKWATMLFAETAGAQSNADNIHQRYQKIRQVGEYIDCLAAEKERVATGAGKPSLVACRSLVLAEVQAAISSTSLGAWMKELPALRKAAGFQQSGNSGKKRAKGGDDSA